MARHWALLPALPLAAGLAAASPAVAQAVAVFSAETSLVNVAVTVEDAQGRPVDGLTARDFVVAEDGRRQKRKSKHWRHRRQYNSNSKRRANKSHSMLVLSTALSFP